MSKFLKLLTVSVLTSLLSLSASADSIRFGGVSTHFSQKEFNDFHRMLFYEKEDYFAGYFYNSYYEDSFAVGKYFVHEGAAANFAVGVGATYGYRENTECYKYAEVDYSSERIYCPLLAFEVRPHLPYGPIFTVFGTALVITFKVDL